MRKVWQITWGLALLLIGLWCTQAQPVAAVGSQVYGPLPAQLHQQVDRVNAQLYARTHKVALIVFVTQARTATAAAAAAKPKVQTALVDEDDMTTAVRVYNPTTKQQWVYNPESGDAIAPKFSIKTSESGAAWLQNQVENDLGDAKATLADYPAAMPYAKRQQAAGWLHDREDDTGEKTLAALSRANLTTLKAVPGHPELVVVTIPHLAHRDDLGQIATKQLAKYHVGNAKKANGIVIAVCADAHQYWIVSGAGLNRIITEAAQNTIIDSSTTKLLKSENYDDAIARMVTRTAAYVKAHRTQTSGAGAVWFAKAKTGLAIGSALILAGLGWWLYRRQQLGGAWAWRVIVLVLGGWLYLTPFDWFGFLGVVIGVALLLQRLVMPSMSTGWYQLFRALVWLGVIAVIGAERVQNAGVAVSGWYRILTVYAVITILWLLRAAEKRHAVAVIEAADRRTDYPLTRAIRHAGFKIPAPAWLPSRLTLRGLIQGGLAQSIEANWADWAQASHLELPYPDYYLGAGTLLPAMAPAELLRQPGLAKLAELAAPIVAQLRTTGQAYEADFEQWLTTESADVNAPAVWATFLAAVGPNDKSLPVEAKQALWHLIALHLANPLTNYALPAGVPAWANAFTGPHPDHTTNYDDRHWYNNSDSGGGSSASGFGGSW